MKIQRVKYGQSTNRWETVWDTDGEMVQIVLDDGATLHLTEPDGLNINTPDGTLIVRPRSTNIVRIQVETFRDDTRKDNTRC